VRKVAWGLALLTMMVPGVTWSLGLGDIEVDSALNQPLEAQIRLHSVPADELEDIEVTLAPQVDFERVGIARPHALTQLSFKPQLGADGVPVISVTTKTPVREPFLDFLVEVRWSKGRLLREYTVLMDPPVMMEGRTGVATQVPSVPAVTQQARAPAPASAPAGPAAPQVAPVPLAAVVTQPAGADAAPQSYNVKRGDTLGEIARANLADPAISAEQMMVAMLRANPQAFVQDNINNLKSGYVLRIPAPAEVESVSRAEALAEVSRQTALWREYRARLAAAAPAPLASVPIPAGSEPAPAENTQAGQGARPEKNLQILAVDEAPVTTGSGAGGADAETARLKGEMALTQELIKSQRKENEDLRSRIAELESMLGQQERIINLQSEELASLQQDLAGAAQEAGIAPVGALATEDVQPAPEETMAKEDVQPAPQGAMAREDVQPAPEETMAEAEPAMPEASGDSDISSVQGPMVQAPQADEMGEMAEAPMQAETQSVAPEQGMETELTEPLFAEETGTDALAEEGPAPETPEAATPQSIEAVAPVWPRFLDDLLANPLSLIAMGGAGIVLIALIWMVTARFRGRGEGAEQQAAQSAQELAPEPAESEAIAAQAAAMAQTEAMDEAATAQTESARQPQGEAEDQERSQVQESGAPQEAVDEVLSEADVYIAYGLHQQAIGLLKEAIGEHPDRQDYHAKLLEAYYGAKNKQGFDNAAQELHVSGAQGEIWERVVVMGRELNPENPLYQATDVGDLSVEDFAPAKPETADIDLGDTAQVAAEVDLQVEVDDTLADASVRSEPGADATQEVQAPSFEDTQVIDLEREQGDEAASEEMDTELSAEDELEKLLEFDVEDLDLGEEGDKTAAAQTSDETVEELLDFDVSDLELGLSEEGAEDTQLDEALEVDLTPDEGADETELLEPSVDVARSGGAGDDTEIAPAEPDTAVLGGQDKASQGEGTEIVEATEIQDLGEHRDATERLDVTEQFDSTERFDLNEQETAVLDEEGALEDLGQQDLMAAEDEVGTKLDLARAYLDMGDADGARSTLEEVMEEGDQGQRKEAEDLLKQIA
jgi:pilus assembly protein FimV